MISENTLFFCKTSHKPAPLLSTQTLAPGRILLAYGKLITSLAWATRMVCKVNPRPVPLATTRSPLKLNAMFTVVKFGTLNT